MISNQKWMLHGALSLVVVLSAAEVRAQKLETPGSPAAEAAPTTSSSGPTGFGDSGQFVLSAERLFGYTYSHRTGYANMNSFTLLAQPLGTGVYAYGEPRIGFDGFVTKSISLGGSLSFFRTSASNDTSTTGFQVAPRIGYGMMVGPWLGVWPRLGVTYVYASGNGATAKYLALTVEGLLAIVVAPHLVITFGPTLDLGLTGSAGNTSIKNTDVGVYFGLAIPF
jgi:hypothetical protein